VKTTTLHNTKTVTTSVTETEVLEIVQEIPVIEQVHNTKTVTTSVTETEVFEIVREIPVIEQVPKQEESYIIDEIDSMGWHQVQKQQDTILIKDNLCTCLTSPGMLSYHRIPAPYLTSSNSRMKYAKTCPK